MRYVTTFNNNNILWESTFNWNKNEDIPFHVSMFPWVFHLYCDDITRGRWLVTEYQNIHLLMIIATWSEGMMWQAIWVADEMSKMR